MAKFNLTTDKLILVRGGLVSLPAGEVETDDEDLIRALSGAIGVEKVEGKPKRKAKSETDAAE